MVCFTDNTKHLEDPKRPQNIGHDRSTGIAEAEEASYINPSLHSYLSLIRTRINTIGTVHSNRSQFPLLYGIQWMLVHIHTYVLVT